MKIYELLSFNRELLSRIAAAGIKPDDCRYIDLFNDFKGMVERGDKVTYAVTVLAERYGISERQVYKIVKRMDSTAPLVQ